MPFQNKYRSLKWLVIFTMLTLQWVILYYVPRSNFIGTYGIFVSLFCLYFFIIRKEDLFSFRFCIGLAILLRLIALFSIPALSDDYFRFIWDGKMSLLHINPYHYTPQEYFQFYGSSYYLQHLYDNINSPGYHTIYPPVMQFIFVAAAFAGNNNDLIAVIVMKLFILAAELGTMRILYLLAKQKGIKIRNILWYILNPLIIVELIGNAHFEGVLLFFFACFLYFLHNKKIVLSALFWMLAVCTKIIPLMLAPLIVRYLGFKKSVIFMLMALATGILLFIPFLNWHLARDINESIKLFYHLLEFNASVFYFIRWLGYFFVDYDIIEKTAPVLGIITFIVIVLISSWPSKKFSFTDKCLWIFSVYFLLATMVHPWYASILIMLAAFGQFRFPIIFSLLILLSYYPYSMQSYNEDKALWLIATEYFLLFIYIIWEIFYLNKKKGNLKHEPSLMKASQI